MKKYFYNEGTGKLHILGCCAHSKVLPYKIKWFETFDEALKYGVSALSMCKTCQKKKEKIMEEAKQ